VLVWAEERRLAFAGLTAAAGQGKVAA